MDRFAVARVATMRTSAPSRLSVDRADYASVLRRAMGGDWTELSSAESPWQLLPWRMLMSRDARVEGPTIDTRVLTALNATPPGADLVVVDLRPPTEYYDQSIPPRALHRIALALDVWCTDRVGRRALVITHELVEPEEFPYKALSALVAHGFVVVLSATGRLWEQRDTEGEQPTQTRLIDVPANQFAIDLGESTTSDLELLRRKTIRRLGYYPRPAHDEINRYFFDGTLCGAELRRLIAAYLSQLDERRPLVVYDLSVSEWLRKPLTGACVDAHAQSVPLSELAERHTNRRRTAPVVVVTPLLQTGGTLDEALTLTRKKFPHASLSGLAIYSIQGQNLRDEIATGSRTIRTSKGPEEVEVSHMLRVDQVIVASDSMLPDVTYYAQRPELFQQERFLSLTSDDFWTMSLDHDLIPERNVPEYARAGLPAVPDFPRIVEENGPWLAWKLRVAASQLANVDLAKVTLVSLKDEPGAEALSDCLDLMFGNRPIAVPREALLEWENADQSMSLVRRWSESGPQWALALGAAPSREAVIIDEFAVSGESIKVLADLVTAFGHSLRMIAALATFSRSRTHEMIAGRRAFFLYETEFLGAHA